MGIGIQFVVEVVQQNIASDWVSVRNLAGLGVMSLGSETVWYTDSE